MLLHIEIFSSFKTDIEEAKIVSDHFLLYSTNRKYVVTLEVILMFTSLDSDTKIVSY